MSEGNTKMFLEVDASQIDIKQLLQKDFLEVSMKAISSANPNRNNSWFTRESMQEALASFVNKPILGYFENGDFVSHNGDWDYDAETDMSYWNTLGSKGERILGIIRESDEIRIVEDENGLSWITFTCALWTQYSFKQVKRLIKDAKRAQKNGGSTKNISVEVDITNYEVLDNGVMKINGFNLVGVTILGTRDGVKVEPGIENAELSVVDIMGRENYCAQEKTLRLAYEKLNNFVKSTEKEKKEESRMEKNEVIDQNSEAQAVSFSDTCGPEVDECGGTATGLEEVCPDCGKNPCECEKAKEEKDKEEPEQEGKHCSDEADKKDKDEDEGEEKDDDPKTEDESKEQACKMEEQPASSDASEAAVTGAEGCEGKEKEGFCDCCGEADNRNPVCDIAWLISDCSWNIHSITESINYYNNREDIENRDYIISVLRRIAARQAESEKELSQLLVKLAEGITADDVAYEAKLKKYSDIGGLITEYENVLSEKNDLVDKLNTANDRIASFERGEFMKQANALIELAHLDDEKAAELRAACENGTIVNLNDLKIQVAVSVFDASHAQEMVSTAEVVYSAPIPTPNTTAAFAEEKSSKTNKKPDHWGALHEYLGK